MDFTPAGDIDDLGLGRLSKEGNLRRIWAEEASVFTPWLAKNIGLLADELGIDLTVTGQEVPAGDFWVDITAEDAQGGRVVIENQLERTDHRHLGQCLIYAAALDATTVVWVAPEFRDEARAAFAWLNRHTDDDVRFFAVEVHLVRIGNSPPAPVFEVVSRPNPVENPPPPPGDNRPRQFISEVLQAFAARHPGVRMPTFRGDYPDASFGSGPFGFWAIVTGKRGGALRVEAYLNNKDRARNKSVFDRMAVEQGHWDAAVGQALSWQRLSDRDASRIAALYPGSLDLGDEDSWARARDWAGTVLENMYAAMDAPLRAYGEAAKAELATAGADEADDDTGEADEDGPLN